MNQKEGDEAIVDNNGEEEFSEEEEEFIAETIQQFDDLWKEVKEDAKELSRREVAQQMFVAGVLMYKQFIEEKMEKSIRCMKEHPEEIEKMIQEKIDRKNS